MSRQLVWLIVPFFWIFVAGVWLADGYGWMAVGVIIVNISYAWFLLNRR